MIKLRTTSILDCDFIIRNNQGKNEDFLHQWAGPSYTYPISTSQILERISDYIYTKFFTATLNDEIIGTVELGFINYKKKECKICRFLIGEEFQNKGYGTEISKLLIDYSFNELQMNKVSLNVSNFNTSAIRCYEKAGFSLIDDNDKIESSRSTFKMEIIRI